MNEYITILDMYFKKLSFLNTQLLKTDNNIFNFNLKIYGLTIRQLHLLNAKKIIKEKMQPIKTKTPPKKYETKLSALHNIHLIIVRAVDSEKTYCKAYNKQNLPKIDFDGYYFKNELKKITL